MCIRRDLKYPEIIDGLAKESAKLTTFQKAFEILTPREQRQSLLVLVIVVIMALFEIAGVASVMPFLAVLANPELVESNPFLRTLQNLSRSASVEGFLLFLGILAFCLLISSAVVRSLGQYALMRFVHMRRYSIGSRLLETYLRQPYEFYLNRHTGDLSKSILSEVEQAIQSVFVPIAQMVAQSFTLIAILSLLFIVDPWVALLSGITLGSAYGLIYAATRNYLEKTGTARQIANQKRFKAANEVLGGIKDIKLLGREHAYLQKFLRPSHDFSRYMYVSAVLGQIPKFLIEAIAFGGILLLSVVLMVRYGGNEEDALGHVLPLLGLYAFAGYRMLPAVQAIYQALSQLRFGAAAIDVLHKDLCGQGEQQALPQGPIERIELERRVRLEALSYGYPNSDNVGVQDISLEIPAGSTLGIVGGTGAGKTTLVDLILGLLKPASGQVVVDQTEITISNVRNWQANIGYVPQDIFLIDASISENIALGFLPAEIDHTKVQKSARLAQIDLFIENELETGYDTKVGERGVRLSGGQKQRIGIARALYLEPKLIIFDEATSALDSLTEKELMQAVQTLQGDKTIIMIAHRLTTIEKCDTIVVLDKGRIVGFGSYSDLASENSTFKKLVQASQDA